MPKKLVSNKDYEEEIEHVLKPGSRESVIKLKPWQLDGVKTILSEHYKDRHSTILADEMGLGEYMMIPKRKTLVDFEYLPA